ncbi:hypothetical protein [Phyllobacterium sp. SB3]|uniref:hypothetical protein n=1 Tax=Phyllobacterium sp. SB3 TaxID=3156073 RepID=UPI0032AF9CD5
MMQDIYDLLHMMMLIFTVVGGFYYLYGLAFIFAVVAARKSKAGTAYRGWLIVALICLAVGLGTHLAARYVLNGFYIPG